MVDYNSYWMNMLRQKEASGQLRRLRQIERLPGARVRIGENPILIDFSSNDYLGLSHHPDIVAESQDFLARYGAGSGASRLVTGNSRVIEEIEIKLAKSKKMEAALVFVSGVQANLTILPAILDARILGAEPLVYADRLNHASLIHGCLAAGVKQIRFRHNDMQHLENLLERDADKVRPRFIITESVFSMDGDCPDLERLALLAERFGAFLYIDEAHATGVFGKNGFGLASGLKNALIMGTFSKGLGGFGAYAAGSSLLREYLVNECGGVIYATALPPAVLGAMNAALDLIPSMISERNHISNMATRLRSQLNSAGISTGKSSTQIVPVVVKDERLVLSLAAQLEGEGYHVVPIRPPTVPPRTSRLRLAVTTMHSEEDIDGLAQRIIQFYREVN